MVKSICRIVFLSALVFFPKLALPWEVEAINLLNQGKASQAINLYQEKIPTLSGDKKIEAIYAMANACFLIDSEICIVDVINKHYADLIKHSEKIEKISIEEKFFFRLK